MTFQLQEWEISVTDSFNPSVYPSFPFVYIFFSQPLFIYVKGFAQIEVSLSFSGVYRSNYINTHPSTTKNDFYINHSLSFLGTKIVRSN